MTWLFNGIETYEALNGEALNEAKNNIIELKLRKFSPDNPPV